MIEFISWTVAGVVVVTIVAMYEMATSGSTPPVPKWGPAQTLKMCLLGVIAWPLAAALLGMSFTRGVSIKAMLSDEPPSQAVIKAWDEIKETADDMVVRARAMGHTTDYWHGNQAIYIHVLIHAAGWTTMHIVKWSNSRWHLHRWNECMSGFKDEGQEFMAISDAMVAAGEDTDWNDLCHPNCLEGRVEFCDANGYPVNSGWVADQKRKPLRMK